MKINQSNHNLHYSRCQQRLTKVAAAVKHSVFVLGIGLSTTSVAATIEVTSHLDDGTRCTLRDAVESVDDGQAVNGCIIEGSLTSNNLITFSSNLVSNTIELTNGQLSLFDQTVPLTIDASSVTDGITIDANGDSRIFYTQSATLTIDNLTIQGGYSNDVGGAIYAGDGTTLSISNSTITGNRSTGKGAGIYLISGNLTTSSSTLSLSQSVQDGGAIYARDSELMLLDTTLSLNESQNGAGLRASNANVTITASTIDSNTGSIDGGGIFISDSSTLTITDTMLTNNTCDRRGGGLYARDSNIAATQISVSDNQSNSGGGMYARSSSISLTNSTLSGNTGSFNGGGIYGYFVTIDISENSRIVDNYARIRGGGIDLTYDSGSLVNSSILTISDSTIFSNTVGRDGSIVSQGGGIAGDRLTVMIENSNISQNTASGYGGGLGLGTSSVLNVVESTIADNSAGYGAGGILLRGSSSANINKSTLSGNSASLAGGAIAAIFGSAEAFIVLSNSTISGNTALTSGGIYSLSAQSIILRNTTFANNAATNYLNLLTTTDSLTIRNSIMDGSYSSSCFANNATIDIDSSSIIEDGSCDANRTGNPGILPLADNGGATLTHSLAANSQAIDIGANCEISDQRGDTRGFLCDVGAYEFNTNDEEPGSFFVIPLSNGRSVVVPL